MTRPTNRPARTQRRLPGVPGRPEDGAGTARIAVDLLGGDEAPAVVVDGALRACGADPDLHLLLVGPSTVADEVLGALSPADRVRVTVRPASGCVAMTDAPVRATRPDTSLHVAVQAVASGDADAVVSAGSSGAIVTAAVLGLGRYSGRRASKPRTASGPPAGNHQPFERRQAVDGGDQSFERRQAVDGGRPDGAYPDRRQPPGSPGQSRRKPALAACLPALGGPVVLLDVGSSVEPHPDTLVWHARLGAAYASAVYGVTAPRVGLLSIGTEPGKGDRARRAAEPLLAATALPVDARFVGLVEGDEVCLGRRADVVVADGFTGNVLLKGIEGAYTMAGGRSPAPRAAVLLGVPGLTVVCHGAATGDDVASGIGLAAALHRGGAGPALFSLISDLAEAPHE